MSEVTTTKLEDIEAELEALKNAPEVKDVISELVSKIQEKGDPLDNSENKWVQSTMKDNCCSVM